MHAKACNCRAMENEILVRIDAFQRETGLSDHRIGMLLANNGRLLTRLRNGGRVWPETLRRIDAALRAASALRNGPEAAP